MRSRQMNKGLKERDLLVNGLHEYRCWMADGVSLVDRLYTGVGVYLLESKKR